MKIYVVLARSEKHCYVFGAYTDRGMAWKAALTFKGDWTADVEERELVGYEESSSSDDIDLQQQVEALQAYVDVLQKKVRLLDNVLMRLLYMRHIREGLGEEIAKLLRDDLLEGRRFTLKR